MALKPGAPVNSPGKWADGDAEKMKDRTVGNISTQAKGATREEENSPCTSDLHRQPLPNLLQIVTSKKLNR